MAMLERSQKQRVVGSTVMTVVFGSVILLAMLLVWNATKLGNVQAAATQRAAYGPVRLFELSKTPNGTGYTAGIQFFSGMIMYYSLWTIGGICLVLLRLKKNRTS